jgi:dTDP-4-amino-4,6-dideoxygalactose transaminase
MAVRRSVYAKEVSEDCSSKPQLPPHLIAMRQKSGGERGEGPATEDISDRLLRLPFYNSMTDADQDRVFEEPGAPLLD